jgi:hypothetical protein
MRLAAIGAFAAAAWMVLATAAPGQELRTLKERLSDKGSDNQRVNNCRVPPERRGPVPRPDCAAKLPATGPLTTAPPGRR